MDTYTDGAVHVNKKVDARQAQERMLGIFKERGVIDPVIQRIEQRIKELK